LRFGLLDCQYRKGNSVSLRGIFARTTLVITTRHFDTKAISARTILPSPTRPEVRRIHTGGPRIGVIGSFLHFGLNAIHRTFALSFCSRRTRQAHILEGQDIKFTMFSYSRLANIKLPRHHYSVTQGNTSLANCPTSLDRNCP